MPYASRSHARGMGCLSEGFQISPVEIRGQGTMLNVKRILTVMIAAVIWTSQGVAEDPVQGKQNEQDRLEVVARILRSVYPDVIDQPSGPAVLQTLFSQGSFG